MLRKLITIFSLLIYLNFRKCNLWNKCKHNSILWLRNQENAYFISQQCPWIAPYSNCHISYLTPSIDVFLSILESTRHKLCIAHGLTLVFPSLREWEAFPMFGASFTLGSLGPLANGALSPGCHSRVPLMPLIFRTFLIKMMRDSFGGKPKLFVTHLVHVIHWMAICIWNCKF